MKKIISSMIILIVLSTMALTLTAKSAYATEPVKMSALELKVINNDNNDDIKIFVLLSKEYIERALQNGGIKYDYDGANTLIQNDIPDIDVEKQYVQDEVYIDNDSEEEIEYVQILLNPDNKGVYKFEALYYYLTDSSRTDNNIRYRIQDGSNDFIAHIGNFKANKNNVYEMEYNHTNYVLKQPDQNVWTFATIFFVVLLVLIVLIGTISYFKRSN